MKRNLTYHRILLVLLLSLLMLPAALKAQQEAQFNQYMFNPLGINPAYAGSRDVLSAVALFRSQWVGFEGAPNTQTFAIHGPLWKKRMGLGFQITNDQIGPRNVMSAEVDYAYRFPFLRGKLSLGLAGGVYYHTFDWNKITYKDQGDVIPTYGAQQVVSPNADFGVWYNTKKFYAGLELAHLTEPRINISDSSTNGGNAYRQFRHYSFTVGRAFVVSDKIVLRPSILYKQAGLFRGGFDLNFSVLFDERLWAGVTIRPSYGGAVILEYIVNKKLRFGYSFDYPLNQFRFSRATSHELFLGYDFELKKPNTRSPRYF